jgi:hypothetical protein
MPVMRCFCTQLRGGVAVPARQQHHRGAVVEVPFRLACMPVTWNIGSTASPTAPWFTWPHTLPATALYIVLRCVCMQPLGWPVVPEV